MKLDWSGGLLTKPNAMGLDLGKKMSIRMFSNYDDYDDDYPPEILVFI